MSVNPERLLSNDSEARRNDLRESLPGLFFGLFILAIVFVTVALFLLYRQGG